ncbi:MAG: altronate dehydratase family protein [Maribacter sp.]
MNHTILRLHPKDNVLVALTDLKKGGQIEFEKNHIVLLDDVPAKHKVSMAALGKNEEIFMYGLLVGKVKEEIAKGELLTTSNVIHQAQGFTKRKTQLNWQAPDISEFKDSTFLGYHRSDGQVGTANYWLVIPLVFCENRNVETMKQAFVEELGFSGIKVYKNYVRDIIEMYRNGNISQLEKLNISDIDSENKRVFENVDGIKFLTHQGGCGGTREDSEMLCSLLAGYINNPNVAGATVLSLGCQNAQISILKKKLDEISPKNDKPLYVLEQQKEGTERALLTKAIQRTFLGMIEANKSQRAPATLDKLTIGLECGGSDGFSGISANPTVGYLSDIIVALGGKTMLAEFPELCGVEQELINRCTSEKIAKRFIDLMRSYSASAEAVGSGFDMNPSPGNIKDGLITDAMKSAGAAKKGGNSPVVDVLDYGEYATKKGLNLLCTPGNDVESTTALAGSGANIILFTTGLGTPTGNPIAPVIKISSNSKLATRMPDIIDFDTGAIISGERTIPEIGKRLLKYIIEVASGKTGTKAQLLLQDDFIPWKRGVSL